MDKKEFIITLGDQQGLRFSTERAEKMIEKGGVLDMVQLIRTIIFQIGCHRIQACKTIFDSILQEVTS